MKLEKSHSRNASSSLPGLPPPRMYDEQQKPENQAAQDSTIWLVCEAWLEHRKAS
ncbi:hypothetical protein P3T17_005263 [Paraburkholderia sp. GAS82]